MFSSDVSTGSTEELISASAGTDWSTCMLSSGGLEDGDAGFREGSCGERDGGVGGGDGEGGGVVGEGTPPASRMALRWMMSSIAGVL